MKRIFLAVTMMFLATSFVFGQSKDGQAIRQGSVTGAARQSGVSEHHQIIADMMKDMSQEMSKMAEQMSRGELTPEQRKHLGQRMEIMSKMMHRMSGLESRPAMKEPEMQQQLKQMRRQMDEMMRDPSMKSPAK